MAETQRSSRPERIGRYRVVDRIGRGAMGIVYSAHDDLMGRDVAIKVMMTDLEGEPEIRARFMREAQVSARLAHRNIVTVFDIGEDNGRLFIVMELLRGQTLGECLKQRTLSLEEKVDLTLEVCDGLAVASAAGVCHRDVKPGNLFLQTDGSVKILDFGIARLASSSMTASGFVVGTPDYMSPEQARGISIDERSDIFSLGAVLYFMLAGRKPFVAPDLPAVLHKVVSEEPPPLESADAPAGLPKIVFKALAKSPTERFQNFGEFSAELGRWRRRYEMETRALAEGAVGMMERLQELSMAERTSAAALGTPPESDLDAWLSELGTSYPDLVTNGADSLRSGRWHRRDVEAVTKRTSAITAEWEVRIAALRGAATELALATSQLEAGDGRGALRGFDSVLRQVPSAAIQSLVDRARQATADQQAQDDRLRSLLAEAAAARGSGRLEAALALVDEALAMQPRHLEAGQLRSRLQHELAIAETERLRQCERSLERARRALQLEQLDEAERQLQLAVEAGGTNPDIAAVSAALADARAARDTADALVGEISSQLARARHEFQMGDRKGAISRLENLAWQHPSSTAATAELSRLRAEDERLESAEKTRNEAERIATEAAAALAKGDAEAATRLAERALALIPSHELALRTSAVAQAQLREVTERTVRQQRARKLAEDAKAFLSRGKFDRAIKEARRAAELDPIGTEASALIAEALRRQADAAAAEAREKEAIRLAAEVREVLGTAASALRSKDFARARMLAERALALDPASAGPKELMAKIATAASLAAAAIEDETVDLHKGNIDPDATAVFAPVQDGLIQRWIAAVRGWFNRVWTALFARSSHSARKSAQVPARSGTNHKEA